MTALLTVLAPIVGDVLKKVIPDADKANEIEREIRLGLLENTDSLEKARASIIATEAASGSWLTASWRPILMLVITAIVAMNYLVTPIIKIFYPEMPMLELPVELWNLLTVGVGGYIVGRSGEKMIDKWSNK
jgi:hypothetical protein